MFGNFGYDLHYKDDSDFSLLFSSKACSLWTLKRNKKKRFTLQVVSTLDCVLIGRD